MCKFSFMHVRRFWFWLFLSILHCSTRFCLLVVFAYLIHSVRDRNYMLFLLGSVYWVFPSPSPLGGDGGDV